MTINLDELKELSARLAAISDFGVITDAQLIQWLKDGSAARIALPELVAEVEQLRAERDAARQGLTLACEQLYAARVVIAKMWPSFPVGSNYTLTDDDKCSISSALAVARAKGA